MKDYNLGLMQPGEEREVNAFGDYVRNIGTGSVKVVARNTEKSVKALSTVLGAGGWRSPESEYNHWVVKNNSAVAIAVSVLIGKGEAGESEVQINADVNALTRFDNLSKDGNRYKGGHTAIGSAGLYGYVALVNPAGSGVVLWCSTLKTSCPNGKVFIEYDPAFPTGVGFLDWTTLIPFKHSKILGNSNGKGKIYSSGTSGIAGSAIAYIPTDTAGSMTPFDYKNAPFKIPPGYALMTRAATTEQEITTNFEWSEEAI